MYLSFRFSALPLKFVPLRQKTRQYIQKIKYWDQKLKLYQWKPNNQSVREIYIYMEEFEQFPLLFCMMSSLFLLQVAAERD